MSNELDLTKASIKAHTNDFLSGDYSFLHMTHDSENTYKLGFAKGVNYAASLMKLQSNEAPTLNRQDETIVLDEENKRTLHY